MTDPKAHDAEVARAKKLLGMRGNRDNIYRRVAVERRVKELPAHVHAAATAQLAAPAVNITDKEGTPDLEQLEPRQVALSKDERQNLERLTGGRLWGSYTTLVGAIADVKVSELRKSIHKSPDFLSTLFQIAIGMAFPPLGKAISSLADQLPTEASNVAYRIALAAADEEKATKAVEKAYELGKGRFENTKTRDEVSKETEEDLFLAKIKDTYKSGIDTVDKSLRSLSDLDLGLVYLAHDVDRLTTEHFVTEVDRLLTEYKNEVEVIGDGGTVFHPWQSTLRYIITDEMTNERFLAVVQVDQSDTGSLFKPKFKEEVKVEMQQDAIQRWKTTEWDLGSTEHKYRGHSEPPSLRTDEIEGVPARLLVSRRQVQINIPPKLKLRPKDASES
jgi:hypothetical protein